MRLFLQNSLSRSKDIFHPRNAPEVKLFTCGPSVYNLPHIGNYRTYLYEDVLQRVLEALGYQVSRMINFTGPHSQRCRACCRNCVKQGWTAANRLKELLQPIACPPRLWCFWLTTWMYPQPYYVRSKPWSSSGLCKKTDVSAQKIIGRRLTASKSLIRCSAAFFSCSNK